MGEHGMPGMHSSGGEAMARDVQPDLPGVLRAAGGIDPAEQAARGGDAGGDRTVPGGAEAGGDLGDHATAVEFVIPGTPIGKGRPRFARRGNFVTAYTPEKTASYENVVKLAAAEAMRGRVVIDGPVQVSVWLWVIPPASWSVKKQRAALEHQLFPTSKPDIDNVVKGVFDAMNDVVWKDDKQVVDLSVFKRYSTTARASVTVRPI